MPMLAGWDWASETHDVTVMNPHGEVVDRWSLDHTEDGIGTAIRRLAQHGQPGDLPVAIETTNGVVVERLLEAGHAVVPIHPAGFYAARARWGASKAKSDPGDSWKLADYLRTDGHRFRRLQPIEPATRHLQVLSRARDSHLAARVAAVNQLEALLNAHWPGATRLFAKLDSRIALAFLDRYPTPAAAARLGEAGMATFLKRHGYSGRRSPTELLTRLRSAPSVPAAISPHVLAHTVRAHIHLIGSLKDTMANLQEALEVALEEHPQANLLAAMPRIGRLNHAQILAEVGPVLDRATNLHHACAEIGASPVTKASGKGKAVHFRWAANSRARTAFSTFADNSRHSSPWAAHLYQQARQRGKRHPQAIRILMRAWLRVAWACWHTNTPYNPKKHHAEQHHAA